MIDVIGKQDLDYYNEQRISLFLSTYNELINHRVDYLNTVISTKNEEITTLKIEEKSIKLLITEIVSICPMNYEKIEITLSKEIILSFINIKHSKKSFKILKEPNSNLYVFYPSCFKGYFYSESKLNISKLKQSLNLYFELTKQK